MPDIPLTDPDREYPNEYSEVEYPMLAQLAGMGWEYLQGDLDYPQKTFREHFREVILKPRLRAAIRKINLNDSGNEYLDDVTIERAIQELQRTETQNLLDRNKELTGKLVLGVKVPWAECPAGVRDNTVRVHFFDFDRWDRNDFLAINQFRVEFIGWTGFVIPDIVLFVNGIPLAVIECKSPAIIEPMNEGINQLLRYSNQRQEVAEDEGVPHLFLFNQLMVSTWFYEARAAALGAEYEYYQEWKDTVPVPREHVAAELGKTTEQLKSQSAWLFLNVKYDEAVEKRRLTRRIAVQPGEGLRTAAERMALLDLQTISPTKRGQVRSPSCVYGSFANQMEQMTKAGPHRSPAAPRHIRYRSAQQRNLECGR